MLISPEYLEQQREMHQNERYGAASKKFAWAVAKLIEEHDPQSILDYGAGKGALKIALGEMARGRRFAEYDPARPRIRKLPGGKFDLVCCIDVLEHIEPECLPDVLRTIRKKTGRLAFVTVHTGPAGKTLPDGRNAHLIQMPIGWWESQLREHFAQVLAAQENETTFFAICEVAG
jgi:SAM-dependent methyltransferase